jgi:hypothetical protein
MQNEMDGSETKQQIIDTYMKIVAKKKEKPKKL